MSIKTKTPKYRKMFKRSLGLVQKKKKLKEKSQQEEDLITVGLRMHQYGVFHSCVESNE